MFIRLDDGCIYNLDNVTEIYEDDGGHPAIYFDASDGDSGQVNHRLSKDEYERIVRALQELNLFYDA